MARLLQTASAGILAVLLAPGCSSPKKAPKPPTPVSVDLQLQASPRINPDPSGNPLSVVLRFYQLRSVAEFSKLTQEQANSDRNPSEQLGPELVSFSELTVVPGATSPRAELLRPETEYIAVVGLFRQPDAFFWRLVLPAKALRASKGGPVVLKIHENRLTVEGAPLFLLPGQPEPRP